MQTKPSVSKSQFEAGGFVIFFYHFRFNSAADVILHFLDINLGKPSLRWLAKHPCSDLIFQKVVLLKL